MNLEKDFEKVRAAVSSEVELYNGYWYCSACDSKEYTETHTYDCPVGQAQESLQRIENYVANLTALKNAVTALRNPPTQRGKDFWREVDRRWNEIGQLLEALGE